LATEPTSKPEDFDDYAENYDEALNRGLSVTGEDKQYFARERIMWLAQRLEKRRLKPTRVLDYGCGTGTATSLLVEILQAKSVIGLDPSARSLERARKESAPNCSFFLNADYPGREEVDLIYCNGVFHHIDPSERSRELSHVMRCLRPGGLFALWENNPWNPGTQYVMSRIPFDRDAVKLSPTYARALLRQSGFDVILTDFVFFFPRFLRSLRRIEPFISGIPLGGQYLVLCRRPGSRT
jgi:SAM-dependent methyltransferase